MFRVFICRVLKREREILSFGGNNKNPFIHWECNLNRAALRRSATTRAFAPRWTTERRERERETKMSAKTADEGKEEEEEEEDSEDEFEFEDIKAHDKALEEDGGGMFDVHHGSGGGGGEEEEKEEKEEERRAEEASPATNEELMEQHVASMRGLLSKSKRLNVHSLGNYTFGVKVVRKDTEKSNAKGARLLRIREQYEKSGGIARRSVAGVCVVNQHGCPHVLLLQESTLPPGAQAPDGKPASQWERPGQHFSASTSTFRLPGGRLRAGEGTREGLKRKLANKLAAPNETNEANLRASFDVLDQLATWYRLGFEPQMYPYLPPHVTKPKETLEVFLVELPEKCYFAVPKTSKLVAVPIFELYDNAEKFGAVASSIPHLLSRIDINLETRENAAV